MSKKKSYMDSSNILNEGFVYNFLKDLFKKKASPGEIRKAESDLRKAVKKSNDNLERFEKAIYKKYGKKVKVKRLDADSLLKQNQRGY